MAKNSKAVARYRTRPVSNGAGIVSGAVHLFLLSVFALILIAGIGYYALKNGQIKINPLQNPKDQAITPTPTSPSPTALPTLIANTKNWKTYTGLGFSFQYPANFVVKPTTKDFSGKLVYSAELVFSTSQQGKLTENFYIEIGILTTDKNDVFELIKENGVGELVKIGANDAIYVGPDTELGDYTYSLVNNRLVYSLSFAPAEEFQGEKFESLKKTIAQILSTFRLLGKVRLTIDKNIYEKGVKIDFQIVNNLNRNIYFTYGCSIPNVYKQEGEDLIPLEVNTELAIPNVTELKPGEARTCVWDQKIWQNTQKQGPPRFQDYLELEQVPPGTYMFTLEYYLEKEAVSSREKAGRVNSDTYTVR